MKMSHKLTEAIQILGPYVINCERSPLHGLVTSQMKTELLDSVKCEKIIQKKDIFSVAPGTEMRSPGTLVFCALKIA